ncbi:glutathione S-transferase family protein [Wenzhouxiangella sediminis]|uniref:Glutathione S-transferase n=1 Tax=Wenzhouxiangella sediminis TaxID=1792836 RepID=A0A3E1K6Q7_9GAMM|nr:glutathione S-transferase [Wenzhouxiangella sediminis]RFF29661.1 glutathione S-transferase [Wenzhouxiangella sediminis]
MKLYTFPEAPSPRRVHLFLAEKGLSPEQVFVDMRKGEHLTDDFAAIHADCTLPVLELDDGTRLSSCAAICRHLESVQPEPALLGATPEARARIDDRDRWVEMNGMLAVMEGFRNSLKGFKDHALPGRRPVAQIPELAERGRRRFDWFMQDLDGMLADHDHVAGDGFSVADITALVTIDFGLRGMKMQMPDNAGALRAWHERVSTRPSVRQG